VKLITGEEGNRAPQIAHETAMSHIQVRIYWWNLYGLGYNNRD